MIVRQIKKVFLYSKISLKLCANLSEIFNIYSKYSYNRISIEIAFSVTSNLAVDQLGGP